MTRLHRIYCTFSMTAARFIASPISLLAVPAGCAAFLHLGGPEPRLTLWLSILALTFSQLVQASIRAESEQTSVGFAALHAKLDELISAGDARNELIRAERRSEEEIERLRP